MMSLDTGNVISAFADAKSTAVITSFIATNAARPKCIIRGSMSKVTTFLCYGIRHAGNILV